MVRIVLKEFLFLGRPRSSTPFLSLVVAGMWEWRCRSYNFIKTTYDISSNSQHSLISLGFSPHQPTIDLRLKRESESVDGR